MSEYASATDRSVLLASHEWTAIGGATALMLVNVVLMYAVVSTPLVDLARLAFAVPIVGMLVYGGAITGGQIVAERGVKKGTLALALVGVGVLQLAFGSFGGAVVSMLPRSLQATALAIAAVVTAVMTAGIGTYVYARSTDFDHYNRWATYAFLGGIGTVFIGTFVPLLYLLGFALVFAGFLFRLGWEMWRIRDQRSTPAALQAIGLYVAVAGVFVHVLQLVVRAVAER